jgi:hypothetical protein
MAEGRITFKSKDPNMSFTCWLGNEGVKPTGGYGGWNIVQRPRRLSLVQWDGRDPIQMDIAILIDGYAVTQAGDSVELECGILEKMAFSDDFDDPPVVNISGSTVLHSGLDYRITNIQWGDKICRRTDGDRVRQEATVSVVRDVRFDKIQLSAAKRLRLKKKKQEKKKKK